MDRNIAIGIAKDFASHHRPSYFTDRASFQPHEWVVEAIRAAYETGRTDGRGTGYTEGYKDASEDLAGD